MTGLHDQICLPDGRVSTIDFELKMGRMVLTKSEHFKGSARGKVRTAYFADVVGEDGVGFEIGKLAYLSRTSQLCPDCAHTGWRHNGTRCANEIHDAELAS